MKTSFFTIILAFLLAFSAGAQEFTSEMKTIFTDTESSSFRIQQIESAIDSKDNVHIVFMNSENHVYYGTNKTGEWSFERLKYFDTYYKEDADIMQQPNIVVDNNDNLHIVAIDQNRQNFVYGMKSANGGEFNLKSVEITPTPSYLSVFSAMSGETTDLAIDKNGGLHFVCKADYRDESDFSYNQAAVYFEKPANAEKWQLSVLMYDKEWDDRSWSYGDNASILCYQDKVYLTFGGSNELFFGSRNISSGVWNFEPLVSTSDEFINSKKWMTSMAVDKNGSLKVAFFDETDDENSPWHGLTVFSKGACISSGWNATEYFDNSRAKSVPSVAFDNNGHFYMALGRNELTLVHQTCDCKATYEKIYENTDNKGDFTNIVVDKNNTIYAFYSSNHDNHLYLLTTKPRESTSACNFTPRITNYTGKTNLKPGEKWTATITAQDPECDKIKFESIIHNDIFTVTDNGNGTATITATMPEGSGTGTPGLSVWALDDKHPDIDDNTSVITFELKITAGGTEEGNITIKNPCK
ncbi:MAG: hypothetical protein JXR53_13885 [Bacteroidales bacterium]|nr:hypothetical protein [Bacteroidales bacterium]